MASKYEPCWPWLKKQFCLVSNDFGFICDGINIASGYITETWPTMI